MIGEGPVIALAGNPNSGKSTLFNALTGLRQHVGNYPGITVEKKWGTTSLGDLKATVVDLPGAYSLVSRSREEAIAFEVLSGASRGLSPSVVVVVLDASNLERNLYFALQVMELGRPVVLALNMIDVAHDLGLEIDHRALAEGLGVPVVPIVASKGEGLDALRTAVIEALRAAAPPVRRWQLEPRAEAVLTAVAERLPAADASRVEANGRAAWLVATLAAARDAKTLGTHDDPFAEHRELSPALDEAQKHLANGAVGLPTAMIEARYRFVDSIVRRAIKQARPQTRTTTDRVDALLLHRVAGPLIFLLVMALLFQSIFAWAQPMMDAIEGSIGWLGAQLGALLPAGALNALLVDGVISGVGAVLVFIPQIAILFAVIAALEDSGYLARAAYIMDRVMARVGLHGRAFVPLLSGFACAIPAIMATRTIESTKDRLVTILVTPLMSCSARLPVYTLVISALFAANQKVFGFLSVGALLMLAMYALSVAATVLVAFVLKRTVLKSPTPPLVLELPPYRLPQLGGVARRVVERCKVFVRDAGTVILACSIVLWGLLSYPKGGPLSFDADAERARITATLSGDRAAAAAATAELDARIDAERLKQSYAGRLGHLLEPVIAPLGFDWKIGIGLVASFAAREVIVSTLGLVYGIGREADEESSTLREVLRSERDPATGALVYTPLVGLSLMVFFLFACQCMSTLAVVRRETASWRWPVFLFAYMTALAWIASFAVYQGGRLLGFT
ncbi:MAG: ferrous iron transport protein B [Deltaproteobacteria bacterium]|nr:ferrous iron transport protein B [Deltaproteobacteria bacterium]